MILGFLDGKGLSREERPKPVHLAINARYDVREFEVGDGSESFGDLRGVRDEIKALR